MRFFVVPALLTALLAAAGCGSTGHREMPFELAVSPAFSPAQQEGVRRACARWNAVAGREVLRVQIVADRDELVVRPAVTPINGVDSQGKMVRGGIVLIGDVLRCDEDTTQDDERCFEAIVMHELGHLLMVQHVNRGVMQPQNAALDFSEEDRAACRVAEFCGGT